MNIYNLNAINIKNNNIYFINISLWKQKTLKDIFKTDINNVLFISIKELSRINQTNNNLFVVWGINNLEKIKDIYPDKKFSVIEDGFIRSKALGSDLSPPLSIVYDEIGIYFDPRSESGLERLISTYSLTDMDKKEGFNIKKTLLENNISKYNISVNIEDDIYSKNPKKKIKIIIGQVEDDASIIFGSNSIKTNLDLLKEVFNSKEENDLLIYKPHPDVTVGNRVGSIDINVANLYCDYIDSVTPISNILKHNNIEIHTITSLTGFENILRGNKTYCYGNPFYAGWGFTYDMEMPQYIKNRRKDLSINDFFTYSYIKYPIYYSNISGELTDINEVISIIKNTKEIKIDSLYMKIRRKIVNLFKDLKNART